MNYTKARNNPSSFLALTSVNITLFDEILPFFTDAHDEYFRWHDVKGTKVARRRCHAIQSNSPLPTVADRLFFIPVYLKNNLIQEYHAACFGMSQQQCGQWIHTLTEALCQAVDDAGMFPASDMVPLRRLLDERGGDAVVYPPPDIPFPTNASFGRIPDTRDIIRRTPPYSSLPGSPEGRSFPLNRKRQIPGSPEPGSRWSTP